MRSCFIQLLLLFSIAFWAIQAATQMIADAKRRAADKQNAFSMFPDLSTNQPAIGGPNYIKLITMMTKGSLQKKKQ